MPLMHRIGTALSGLAVAGIVLLVVACLVAAWIWAGRDASAKGQRGRLRKLGWCAALLVLTPPRTS